jgi:hypothetical protein
MILQRFVKCSIADHVSQTIAANEYRVAALERQALITHGFLP